MSFFTDSMTTDAVEAEARTSSAPDAHVPRCPAPNSLWNRVRQHHVFALAFSLFYFAVFLWMQVNRLHIGLTPIERTDPAASGWPMIIHHANPLSRYSSLADFYINLLVGIGISVCVASAINRLGQRQCRLTLGQLFLFFAICSLVMLYFCFPWRADSIHRVPDTLHMTEVVFIGIGLVCTCYQLPGMLLRFRREYVRRMQMIELP